MTEKQCEKCRGDGSNPTEKVYRGRVVYEKCKDCDGKGFILANKQMSNGGTPFAPSPVSNFPSEDK